MGQDVQLAQAVAVVGMSCRFAPDLDSPEKFWAFLAQGRSTVSEMPDKRWEPYAKTSPQATTILRQTTRKGSFLEDIEGFDADFFGISPREADYLDPQQRIVLELAWEALANAGIPPLSLRGSQASVFVAANTNDYGRRLLEDIARTGAYAVNGTTYYGIANRISYFLDLRGPSVAVDTACAGSLTALHYACQSLRLGETPVAIVGGVNIMATPALFVALDAAGATSPDGRSKAFDRAADGYGRGEGAGVVVLKRLADALRDGDPVLALIQGSGVFQDGRSDGMMAPNNEAQEHMLRVVYDRAGVAPDTVGYVEAHGTGTPVGDREEAAALARVFGTGRPAGTPCLIGSVKPNIGHVEAGSGIAGVIKTVLALRKGQIPPSLHGAPHPDVDWERGGLRLVAGMQQWPELAAPRRAGVSSYGVGGTIAHVILQEAPPQQVPSQPERTATTPERLAVFPVSAMSEAGLRALAGELADWLGEHSEAPLASVGHTLARRRSHLAQRAAIVAGSTAELRQRLTVVAQGGRAPGVATGRTAAGQATGAVWVFSGHGAQWPGMGQQLLREEPAFAEALDSLAEVFQAELGWTPHEALAQGGPWTTVQIQALTFAVQVGLAAVWRHHGVEPGAVIGHSVGEIAAAVAAGCLEVEPAARFACRRAAALRPAQGLGAMALVDLPFDDCQAALADADQVVASIAASPGSSVVSGDRAAVEQVAQRWRSEGRDVRTVDTDLAFHSPHVDVALAAVVAAASELNPQPARVPLYSTALADPRSEAPRDQVYWGVNLRQPVRFAAAVEAAIEDGHRIFLEISSHPVVSHSITESLSYHGVEDAAVVASMRRDNGGMTAVLAGLAALHCNGAAVDWQRAHPGGELLALPAVAWQHRPYWIFPATGGGNDLGAGHDPDRHTLLGGRLSVSGSPAQQVWQTHLDLSCRPYPQSHEVVDVEITPAAVIINTFIEAAGHDGDPPALTDLALRTPVAVTPPRVVQIVLAENAARLSTRIASEEGDSDEREWITHCTAILEPGRQLPEQVLDLAAIRQRCTGELRWSDVDEMFRRMGVGGYAFPWEADELRRNDEEQLAILTLEPAPARQSRSWAHVIDGALTISAVVVTPPDARRLWMSTHIDSVLFKGEPPARIIVHSRRSPQSPQDTVDVLVADETGKLICTVTGLRFAALQDQFGATVAPRDLVHELAWQPPASDRPQAAPVRQVVLIGTGQAADEPATQLRRSGVTCTVIGSPEELAPGVLAGVDAVVVVPAPTGDLPSPQAAEEHAWTLIRTAQQLAGAATAADPDQPQARLWCLTRGVRQARDEHALSQGPLWGVARIIAGEHPELWGGVIDIADPGPDPGQRLCEVLSTYAGQEDVISLAGDELTCARLRPVAGAAGRSLVRCDPSGTYLITGGLGSLGLAVARWLADRGARRLLLAGRRGLPPRDQWDRVTDAGLRRQIEEVRALEALGVTVRALALDITDADQVAAALAPATSGLPPVRGIVHAAGVVRDAMVDKVERDGLTEVLAPKAQGAMVLHRLFPPGSLDFFVLFSSCGQFARLTGQTNYAAANSFLDTLAAHRHAQGHPDTVSLGWTSWQGLGMSEAIASTMLEANARGLGAISATEAFRAWSFADRFRAPYQAVLRVLPTPPQTPKVPMFRDLTAVATDTGDDQSGFAVDWSDLAAAREQFIADVREQVAAELNLDADDVEVKRPLVELGVDSVMTVALRVRMQRRYGLDLPPNILWSRPTVAALVDHLVEHLAPADASGEAEAA